jgi:hypothetical protein
VLDPTRERQYELQSENEWLLNGEQVLVNALDDHNAHVMMHTRLSATPWLRKPDLAQKLWITNAPQIMQIVQNHIMQPCSTSAATRTIRSELGADVSGRCRSTEPSHCITYASRSVAAAGLARAQGKCR